MRKFELSPQTIASALSYDPGNGGLLWKERSPETFLPSKKRTQEWICSAWNAKFAGREAFTATSKGYRVGSVNGQMLKAHRVAFALMTGRWPVSEIDHINGDPSDNRWENLREATRAENCKNISIKRSNTSGAKGVHFEKRRQLWRADIYSNGQAKHIGYFSTVTEASAAYEAYAKIAHGEFYRSGNDA